MILIAAVALLAVGIEVGVRLSQASRGTVEIVNGGNTTLHNLVVAFGGSRIVIGDLNAGESTHVEIEAGSKNLVTLEFTQDQNPLTGITIDDIETDRMQQEGLNLVLVIKPNEVARYMADGDESEPSLLERLRQRIGDWIMAELLPSPGF